MTILIDIPGKPIPFKAPQVYQSRTFNPRHAEKKQVQDVIKDQYANALLTCPLCVYFVFYFEVPKSFSKKKTVECLNEGLFPMNTDADNMCKFYSDCLNNTVIEDDSLIVDLYARKRYSTTAHTVIQIKEKCRD